MLFTVPSNLFSYNASYNQFVSELSDIEANVPGFQFGQVWGDACDSGFIMVSERTGNKITFVMDDEDCNNPDGEVTAWTFVPTKESLLNLRKSAGLTELERMETCKVVLFND